MQENHVNMQDKNFDIQGTYAYSKLPIFFKICFNMGNSFYLPDYTQNATYLCWQATLSFQNTNKRC